MRSLINRLIMSAELLRRVHSPELKLMRGRLCILIFLIYA